MTPKRTRRTIQFRKNVESVLLALQSSSDGVFVIKHTKRCDKNDVKPTLPCNDVIS